MSDAVEATPVSEVKEEVKEGSIESLPNLPNVDAMNTEMDKREAIEAVVAKLQVQTENDRRQALVGDLPTDTLVDMGNQQVITAGEFLTQSTDDLDKITRRANRKMEHAGLTEDSPEIKAALRQALAQRLPQLEAEWANHRRKKEERQTALAVEGENALTEDERTAMQQAIDDNDRDMKIISGAWDEAKKKMAELDDGAVAESK